jgi:excisionase family DNA binding protein
MPKELGLRAEVYKPSEVAKMLRVDLRTVYGMIERDEIPQIKVGRVIRIPRGPVDALFGRKPPSSEAAPSDDDRQHGAGD